MREEKIHEPVMAREVIEVLHIKKNAKFIDATLGTGGHSLEIVKHGGIVLGIEMDPFILGIAEKRFEKERKANHKFVRGNFRDIDTIAKKCDFAKVSGILFDLGVTNLHLKDRERGFSFENPQAPLDMRIDPESQGVKASDLLNVLRQDQLVELFEVTLEFGAARWLAKRVVQERKKGGIETVGDFLRICQGLRVKRGLNPATLPFLALRVAVNSELENLREALPKAYELLEKGGRILVISFHSGEDRIVKEFFKKFGGGELIQPGDAEIERNPRSRSAKLRILQE